MITCAGHWCCCYPPPPPNTVQPSQAAQTHSTHTTARTLDHQQILVIEEETAAESQHLSDPANRPTPYHGYDLPGGKPREFGPQRVQPSFDQAHLPTDPVQHGMASSIVRGASQMVSTAAHVGINVFDSVAGGIW